MFLSGIRGLWVLKRQAPDGFAAAPG